jgi:F0F1-type ATP synthase membrane subunit b/b'
LAARSGPHASYVTDVLPAVIVFGLGLSLIVASLTTTVLATADTRHADVASGVNNAVARAAELVAANPRHRLNLLDARDKVERLTVRPAFAL